MSPDPQENPKHKAILDAASRMFLAYGYAGASMDAIAEAAPVSKPTLYNHFKDKKTLFAAVIGARCQRILAAMPASIDNNRDVRATLTSIAMTFIELVHSPDAISVHRFVSAECAKFPELGEMFYASGPKQTLTRLSGYFQHLHAEGLANIPDPAMAASQFFSMLKGDSHTQCLLGMREGITPQEQKRIAQAAVSFFLKGVDYAG